MLRTRALSCQVWKKRFGEIYSNFKFIHLYTPQDLIVWNASNASFANIFLIDYEFIGIKSTGLNLIDDLGIAGQSYLVTSRHEDSNIYQHCEKIGLKIIPKKYAVYIPICLGKH